MRSGAVDHFEEAGGDEHPEPTQQAGEICVPVESFDIASVQRLQSPACHEIFRGSSHSTSSTTQSLMSA
jgi:hypothetical protein